MEAVAMKKIGVDRFGPYLDGREQQIDDDYQWGLHDPEVVAKYAGKVIVVFRRKIWGVGKTHTDAWTAAQRRRGCPAKDQVAVVVVPPPSETAQAR
jgi:hypothetical protein